MGASKDQFDVVLAAGHRCSLPDAKDEHGVTKAEEETLSEINGGTRGVQPRACMTIITT
jgi:hypothetical protein